MPKARRAAAVAGSVILALTAAVPVAAEDPVVTGDEFETFDRIGIYTDADGLHVVGYLDRHPFDDFQDRVQGPRIALVFRDAGGAIVHSLIEPMMLATAAYEVVVPWHVVVTEDVSSATTIDILNERHPINTTTPVGGLDVSPATLEGLTATGTVENDSTTTATNVVVVATLKEPEYLGASFDTAASTPIATLAPGATAIYSVTFNAAADPAPPDAIVEVAAETRSGPYLTSWENFFADLPPSPFSDDILALARERLIAGCSDGLDRPLRGVTRGQMATFLDRALELPDTDVDYFGDDDGHWAEDSINRLAEAGISDGCDVDMFCPSGRVNRGQIAKFIVLGYGVPSSPVDAYTDDETSTTEAYHDAMAAAGLANGCNAFTHRYCPNRQLTREEMAAFLARAEGIAP